MPVSTTSIVAHLKRAKILPVLGVDSPPTFMESDLDRLPTILRAEILVDRRHKVMRSYLPADHIPGERMLVELSGNLQDH
jgi:hypothetical protein